MFGNCDAKRGDGFGIPLARLLLVIQPLALLEIVPPVVASDTAARLAAVEEGTPIVGDAALTELSAMWATIFQQQVRPELAPAGQLTLAGASSIDSAADTTSSTNDWPSERVADAGASPRVIDLLCLLQGGGCGMQPQIPIVNAEQDGKEVAAGGELAAGPRPHTTMPLIQASPAAPASREIIPRANEQEAAPVVGTEVEAVQVFVVLPAPTQQKVAIEESTEDAQERAQVLPVTSTEVKTVDLQPGKKVRHLKTVVAATDSPAAKGQRPEGQSDVRMPLDSIPDARIQVAEATQVQEYQSVVGFRKQLQEKPNFEVAEVAQILPATPKAATSESSEVRVQQVEQGIALTLAETPTDDAGLAAAEVEQGEVVPRTPEASHSGPQTALKDCELPETTAKQDPVAVQANPPNPATGVREQMPVDSRQPAHAARRPSAPVEAEPPTSFVALSPRESKTISIRIPLTDSTTKPGSPAAHIDLVFHQRNQDLTLQFRSPSSEIQRNFDESLPTLIDSLKNENWGVRPQDAPSSVLPSESSFDGHRRSDFVQPAAAVFEASRQIATQAQSGSQDFSFDDQTNNQHGSRDQKQGRSRKREQIFQSEFDEQQQS